MSKRYFSPKLFAFLKDLAENNDREWFKANQDAYEEYVREPALEFINDFAAPLKKISQHFVADSRTVGGSLFRIQRDTRFSKDKTGASARLGALHTGGVSEYKGGGSSRLRLALGWDGTLSPEVKALPKSGAVEALEVAR